MHRAGYVCGGVALRGVVSHRCCGAGPGPVVGLVACPSSAGHRRSCRARSSCPWSCDCLGPAMRRSRPLVGGDGSSADPRCWSSVLRGSSPGGVLPVDAQEATVDTRKGRGRAGPIGLERVTRTDAGFESAPHQGQREAVLASHRCLGPGSHRKLRSWCWSETGAGKGKSRLWEAAPRRLRLACRRLRGCLRDRLAQIGVRGATGPPDDGQREAAHLAPHLPARSVFHRNRLLLRGETVARPFAGCDQLAPTSTEFLGSSCLGPSMTAQIPYGTRDLGGNSEIRRTAKPDAAYSRTSRGHRGGEGVPNPSRRSASAWNGPSRVRLPPTVVLRSAALRRTRAGGLAGQGPRCRSGPAGGHPYRPDQREMPCAVTLS